MGFPQQPFLMTQGNEARLAALHDLTRLPVEELVKCSEACADKDPAGQSDKRKAVRLFSNCVSF